MKKVVIVGGGFSGAITAVNLARFSAVPVEVTVVNRTGAPCRGVAYSTQHPGHYLNVVARNMSALADQPNHFVEWLGTRSEYAGQPVAALRDLFAPRKVYGDYLHGLFHWYATMIAPEKGVALAMIPGEVVDISPGESQATVVLDDGRRLAADKVVLAIGNQPPAPLRVPGLDPLSPKYINDPWLGWERRLPPVDQDILLVGTGLTMFDVVITLLDMGWSGKIRAVSRHGLLPLSHFQGQEYPDLLSGESNELSLREMFALFKRHYRRARRENINPAVLVDKLRPYTQRLWQGFSTAEKRRFNRHLRARWNPTRHRIAPAVHKQLTDAIAQGRLEILRGRIRECAGTNSAMRVTIEHSGARQTIEAAAIVNCTGPAESYDSGAGGLMENLLGRGLAQADDMNMGIKVSPDLSLLDAEGQSSEFLYALGSMLKGTLWESTAVPELRSQAFRVAEIISAQLAPARADKIHIAEAMEDVIEYSI